LLVSEEGSGRGIQSREGKCASFARRFKEFGGIAKHFLLEAVCFHDGSCPLCITDNISVVVVAGSGSEAVIAPEMAAFARALGLALSAHHLGHSDRKGRIERPFSWVEGNVLVGCLFVDFDD
jgi:hypothetical protein